jgi:hypothetical protein
MLRPVALSTCLLSFIACSAYAEDSLESQAYFRREVTRIAAATNEDLTAVTRANWEETRQGWRSELQEMLGLSPWPERTDLQTTIVGSIALDGVRVERLHYQSSPGLYVAANLYQPLDPPPADGWPAVLYVCGHARVTDHGRLLGNKTNYQHHGLWFARHGVVCLMIDTIQLGEFHGEHHGTYKLGRWDWISRGYTPAGVEAWNAIRGVDVLESLASVDGTKIGITGRSGGGVYSWFAAALDDRIQAAVPVAGITDLQNHVVDGCVEGHCDCMYFVNYFGWDYGKLAALVAPRALLLANSDSDGIFPLDGVMRTHAQLSQLYARLGQSANYGLLITPGPHKDTQELQVGAFKWLLEHLTGREPVIDAPALKEIAVHELAVFEAETPADERVTSVGSWFVPTAKTVKSPEKAAELWQTRWLPELRRLGALPPADLPALHGAVAAQGKQQGYAWSLFNADGEAEGVQILRVGIANEQPPIVHVGIADAFVWNEDTVGQVLQDTTAQQLLSQLPARSHFFVKWRGSHWLPQTAGVAKKHQLVRRFYLLGQMPEQVALTDLLRAIRWIDAQDDAPTSIELAGVGRSAAIVTLAALCLSAEPRPFSLITALHLSDYPTDPMVAPAIPGLLRVCDFSSLRTAAEKIFRVQALEIDAISQPRLVDTSAEPQQAGGMRIVNVSDTAAQVRVRATRWPLPNLGDLPEVEFKEKAANSKRNVEPILPALGVEGLRFAVPGVPAEVRVGHRARRGGSWEFTDWVKVMADTDFSWIASLEGLQPAAEYEVRTQVRGLEQDSSSSSLSGSFRTLPSQDTLPTFRLAVGTCQAFVDRDGPHGFDLYRTLLERGIDAFVMAGDVVYYDALARSRELAYYHWQRTYGLPTLLEFHRQTPTFFLKDDHDTYVDDSWPGYRQAWTGDFSFEDGQQIFVQETGLPNPAYRTFPIGSDLQVWLMEGRDFRSPNSAPDGPQKSIWGQAQKDWLRSTFAQSTAKFRIVISPTPLVGPDRDNKRDNHANQVFATEGREIRQFLASQANTVSVCGDRHWQFHSIDPDTGLHEFSVGPASERHAGGWKQDDFRPEMHQYLRVGGGYLEIELSGAPDGRRLTLRHMDTLGREHHRHTLP